MPLNDYVIPTADIGGRFLQGYQAGEHIRQAPQRREAARLNLAGEKQRQRLADITSAQEKRKLDISEGMLALQQEGARSGAATKGLDDAMKKLGVVSGGLDIVRRNAARVRTPEDMGQLMEESITLAQHIDRTNQTGLWEQTMSQFPSQPLTQAELGRWKTNFMMGIDKVKADVEHEQRVAEKMVDLSKQKEIKDYSALKELETMARKTLLKTKIERQQGEDRTKKLLELSPDDAYTAGYRVNDDGKIFVDPITKQPQKLGTPAKVMGAGEAKATRAVGDLVKDASSIRALLVDPEVQAAFKGYEDDNPSRTIVGDLLEKGAANFRKWMAKKGITKGAKIDRAIIEVQRLASGIRKEFLGAAVTNTELESVLPWLPDASSNYASLMTKIDVIEGKGREKFRRILDVYKDSADLAPWYSTYLGETRFAQRTKKNEVAETWGQLTAGQKQQVLTSASPEQLNELRRAGVDFRR